ncbi:MAG: thiamine-phosphate kinase [Candidatus Bathyarchaeota archaeon]|nr:thiamine-phosphate kinase [Candidatus Bathyarchaeum tardum]WNZ28641.1 MAG: thiamine-phosphate kinase [Candidatus Bathyarchaeota archaeon]
MSSAKELGERKIIKIILENLDQMPNMLLPFGDDASAVEVGNNKLVVINMDMLVKKTDVPQGMSIWQAARKAAVMNISDLAAKGAKPVALLASLGVPDELSKTEIQQIAKGLNAGAQEYGAYVLGGDTNQAPDLIISCMALGECSKYNLLKRSGAKPGDYVAVTGSFGKTAAGLKILMEKLSLPENQKTLVDSVLMPCARVKEGIALTYSRGVTASIDSSDGLAWSLHELSRASNVGFCIDNLLVDPEAEKFAETQGLNSSDLALYGGEEYELIVTVNPDSWIKAQKAVTTVGGLLTKIGVVTKEKRCLLKVDKKTVEIKPRGWEHFITE